MFCLVTVEHLRESVRYLLIFLVDNDTIAEDDLRNTMLFNFHGVPLLRVGQELQYTPGAL